jgi:glycerophosphoryl diester phosphodiesterase
VSRASRSGIEIIGHRGNPVHFPENTLPSLLGAVAAGARSVEFDVRVAACGTPVLLHDATLDRTTDGSGSVEAFTLDELRDLDAGSWFDPAFRGTRVPSLEEALAALLPPPPRGPGHRIHRIYAELKGVRESGDLARILERIRRTGTEDRVILISLDFELLLDLRARAPELTLGFVAEDEGALADALPLVRQDPRSILDARQELLRADPLRTTGWVEEGIRLVTWTVNEEAHARELLALGIRRLTTDDPGGLLQGGSTGS